MNIPKIHGQPAPPAKRPLQRLGSAVTVADKRLLCVHASRIAEHAVELLLELSRPDPDCWYPFAEAALERIEHRARRLRAIWPNAKVSERRAADPTCNREAPGASLH